jgi:hypothetical protein
MDSKPFFESSTATLDALADPASSDRSDGISAIVARIHERAVQLANEQDALQAAVQQLESVELSLAVEQQRSQQVRSKFLKSVVQANLMELECSKIQDLIAERMSTTVKLKQQESRILQRIENQRAEWEAVVVGKLVQHKVRQELYQKHLQGAIDARNNATARRNLKLETSARLVDQLQRDRESILQEQKQVQADMMCMTEAEDEANKQVEALALQVRAALAKVSQTLIKVASR